MSVYLSTQKVIKDWIDYNDHMNVSYYLLMFDKYGADSLNNIFKMGEHSAKTTKKSTMIVESHITYNQELQLDDEVDINCVYFDHDKKRLQYKMEMIHKEKKYLASTIEVLALYVDLNERKVSVSQSKNLSNLVLDIYFTCYLEDFNFMRKKIYSLNKKADLLMQNVKYRKKKLIACDMDMTIINVETINLINDNLLKNNKISNLTQRFLINNFFPK